MNSTIVFLGGGGVNYYYFLGGGDVLALFANHAHIAIYFSKKKYGERKKSEVDSAKRPLGRRH